MRFDNTFVRELPGDKETSNTLRQVRGRLVGEAEGSSNEQQQWFAPLADMHHLAKRAAYRPQRCVGGLVAVLPLPPLRVET